MNEVKKGAGRARSHAGAWELEITQPSFPRSRVGMPEELSHG